MKEATSKKQPSTETEIEPAIRIIKEGTCPTLSGKSTLTYHIGSNDQSEILIRVHANSGGGYFNQEWVPLSAIQETLKKYPAITSFALRSLYVGKSSNSPGFLLAVIKAEGLVQLKGEKERSYVAMDSAPFLSTTKALMDAKPDAGSSAASAVIKKATVGKVSPK